MNESPDLEFSYGDADFYDSEIAGKNYQHFQL